MSPAQKLVIAVTLLITTTDGYDILAASFAAPSLTTEWRLSPRDDRHDPRRQPGRDRPRRPADIASGGSDRAASDHPSLLAVDRRLNVPVGLRHGRADPGGAEAGQRRRHRRHGGRDPFAGGRIRQRPQPAPGGCGDVDRSAARRRDRRSDRGGSVARPQLAVHLRRGRFHHPGRGGGRRGVAAGVSRLLDGAPRRAGTSCAQSRPGAFRT